MSRKQRHGTALLWLAVLAAVISAVSGCGNGSAAGSRVSGGGAKVEDVLENGIKAAGAEEDEQGEEADMADPAEDLSGEEELEDMVMIYEDEILSTTEGIDIDLTMLSATMIYAEVFNMMMMPEEFVGKIVRMEGTCSFYEDEKTGVECFTCIIKDATACCWQGIEFRLADRGRVKHGHL